MSADPVKESSEFMKRWGSTLTSVGFTKYFQKEWHKKVTGWATQIRTYPHADQNTNGSIERYHGMLKAFLRIDKPSCAGQNLRWLIGRTEIWEENLWANLGKQFQGHTRNKNVENLVWPTIHKAREITASMKSLMKGPGGESWALV